MIETSLELQKAIRARLVDTPAVVALVPPARVFDRHSRPEQFPCVVIGEAQTILEPLTLTRSHVRAVSNIHVWTRDGNLAGTKEIAGAITRALTPKPSIDGLHLVDWLITGVRYMRDPGEIGHAVITVEALVSEKVLP